MTILQCNTIVNSGSTGRIAENIGLVLQASGHESYLAYGREGQLSQLRTIKIGSQWDVYAHGAKTLLTDKHGFGSKQATRDFIKRVEEIQPDAIGLHNLHGYYINIELLFNYLKKTQIPVLWTFHDCWPFTGHCTYFDSVNCEKWITGCYACPKKEAYPKSLVDGSKRNYLNKKKLFTSLKNLQIITPSNWLKNHVANSFLKDYEVSVIHNGIDLSVFRPAQETKKEKIILGVASTWDKRKGLENFYGLRSRLSDEWEIVLIGLSDKQIKQLPNGIRGIARTENIQELVMWYSKSFCYVNPTYQDNFPTTNIEALACGTPVVTYHTGGSPEAINEETGRVVEKGDINGLVKAIYELEKVDRDKLRTLCRKRAESKFDQRNCYKEYLVLFNELIKKNKA